MDNVKKKYVVKNININDIDMDSFHVGLLSGVTTTKEDCKVIDKRIERLSLMKSSPIIETTKPYDNIINLINTKNRLIDIYKLFKEWYKDLSEGQKKLFVAFFVKKNMMLARDIKRDYLRHISALSKNFTHYVTSKLKTSATELLSNPYIYNSYLISLGSKEIREKTLEKRRMKIKPKINKENKKEDSEQLTIWDFLNEKEKEKEEAQNER